MLIELFRTTNDGGRIGEDQIHRFSGGLFRPDATLDALRLPNHLFCKRGQGRNPASIEGEKSTLLWLGVEANLAERIDKASGIAFSRRLEGKRSRLPLCERERSGGSVEIDAA